MRKQRSVVEDTRGGAAGGWTTDLSHLVELHKGYCWQQARRYAKQGVDVEDLVQEGFIGVLEAALRFDPGKGVRFLTYARWWIRHRIGIELATMARVVRAPESAAVLCTRLGRETASLTDQLGRPPTDEELAQETGLSLERVADLRGLRLRPLRLDEIIPSGGDDTTHHDLFPHDGPDPAQEVEDRLRIQAALQALAKLPPREAYVLRSYFGLDGAQERDSAELAVEMNVSRQRVHQLKHRGLERLRAALPGWQ